MPQSDATVAIASSSAALSSILAAALSARGLWRVRTFGSLHELGIYMRIAPVDAVVADYALPDGTLVDFAAELRHGDWDAAPLAILALTRTITPEMRRACLGAGIDEVIVKPMSPSFIEERVAAHLDALHPATAAHVGAAEWQGENVVSFAAHKLARRGDAALRT